MGTLEDTDRSVISIPFTVSNHVFDRPNAHPQCLAGIARRAEVRTATFAQAGRSYSHHIQADAAPTVVCSTGSPI